MRALWPSITCAIPSRLAKAIRPSAGLSFTRHHGCPELLGHRECRADASRRSGLMCPGRSRGVSHTPRTSAHRGGRRSPGAEQARASALELIQTITRSERAWLEPFTPVGARPLFAIVGDGAQRQFAQRRDIGLAEKIRVVPARPSRVCRPSPVADGCAAPRRFVHVDHFVGAIEQRVGDRFPHAPAR